MSPIVDIQFFYSSPFSQHSQLRYLLLPTRHCVALYDLQDTMPFHWSTSAFHRILSMCLCSYTSASKHMHLLDCNQLLIIQEWYLSMSKWKMVYFWWTKKAQSSQYIKQQPRISSHSKQLSKVIIKNCSFKKWFQNTHFNTAPGKNAFKNCYYRDFFY